MALRLVNWDQIPAGKFSLGGEVSAVAPHHLEARRSRLTSSPSTQMGLMHRWSQSSLPLKAVLAMCSGMAQVVPWAGEPGPMHSDGTSGAWCSGTESFLCMGPHCPAFPAGLRLSGHQHLLHTHLLSPCPLTTVISCSLPHPISCSLALNSHH